MGQYDEYYKQGFVSQHVPMPFEFIAKRGALKQDQYDNALAQADAAEEAFKINAIDQHQQFKQQKQKEYNDKLTEISDYIVKTGDTSKAREIKSLANRWKNDPLVNELQTSYTQYALDNKDILESKQKGVYTDVYDPRRDYKGVDDQGNIVGYRAKGVKPLQDYFKHGSELMKGIAASGNNGKDYVINADGTITGKSSSWKAVLDKDVDRVAKESLTAFIKDPAGQYFIDEYRYKINPKASAEELTNAAYKYLKGLGNKQVFSETSGGRDYQGSLSEDAYDRINQPKPKDFIYERPQERIVENKIPIDISKLEKKPRYDENVRKNGDFRSKGEVFVKTQVGESYGKLNADEQKIYDNIAKSLYPNKNKDSEEVRNGIKEYLVKASELATSTPYTTTPYKGIKGESRRVADTKELKNNFQNRMFYSLDDNKALEGNSDDIKEVFQNKDSNIEVIGEFDNKNHFNMLSGKEGFEKPLTVNINGSLYAVTPSANKLAAEGNLNGVINKHVQTIYSDLTAQPFVEKEYDINGFKRKITYDPNKDEYKVKYGDKFQNELIIDNSNLTIDDIIKQSYIK